MKYVLSLILLIAGGWGAPVFAGNSHHNTASNNTATAAAVATGSASAVGGDVIALPSGTAGGLSNGWHCAVSNSATIGFFGLALTSNDELCQIEFQMARVCRMAHHPRTVSPDVWPLVARRCDELQTEFANWKLAKSPDVDTAAE